MVMLQVSSDKRTFVKLLMSLGFYAPSEHFNLQHYSSLIYCDSASLDIVCCAFVNAYCLQGSYDSEKSGHDATSGSDGFDGRASEWCGTAARGHGAGA